jgi:hypothetical protein
MHVASGKGLRVAQDSQSGQNIRYSKLQDAAAPRAVESATCNQRGFGNVSSGN